MKIRKNKSHGLTRERRARQQTSQTVFRRGASLDMQRLHKIAAEKSTQRHTNNRLKIHKFAMYLTILVAITLFFIYMFGTKINNVNIKPVDARVDQTTVRQYQDVVDKIMDSSWLGSFKPFINSPKIASILERDHPEIDKVSVKANFFSNHLTVVVSFKTPALIWQTKNGQRFYVSDSGQTFKVNYSHIGDDSLVKLFDTSGLSTTQGKTVVSNDEITFVTSVNKQLGRLGIKVGQYSIPASSKEVNLVLSSGQKYSVKLLSSNDAGQEVAQLKQSLNYFKKHPDQTPKKYLDLRIIGKAFYQ